MENKFSESAKIENVLRQECFFSPGLVNLYKETILKELNDLQVFILRRHNLSNTDDTDDRKLRKKFSKLLVKKKERTSY